jgi:hypothetical protein
MLACFKVPVGTATAGCPSSISAPHRATVLFGTKLDQVDDQPKSAAKLAVHLLKQPQQPQQQATSNAAAEAAVATAASLEGALSLGLGPAGSSSGVSVQGILHSRQCAADSLAAALASEQQQQQGETAGDGVAMSAAVAAAADALDSLVQLLEQYCHPSNTGGWSGDLAVFLRHGVHYFMKVCVHCAYQMCCCVLLQRKEKCACALACACPMCVCAWIGLCIPAWSPVVLQQ